MKCNTMEPSWKSRQVNEQSIQDKSKIQKKYNTMASNTIDCFLAVLEREADMMMSLY